LEWLCIFHIAEGRLNIWLGLFRLTPRIFLLLGDVMKADAKTEAEVMAMLDRFIKAYHDKDLKGILQLFSTDPDVVFYGNGEDEKSIGVAGIREQAEHDWSQSATVSLVVKWSSISSTGTVAWLAADIIIHAGVGGMEMSLPARLTAVLEKFAGQWFFMQWHTSLPTIEEPENK
jgi:ketosteroid isomerase-like protein